MTLTLSVLRCPPGAEVPEVRRSTATELGIGRGPGTDWVLADPTRVLSKRHCVLRRRPGGRWQLLDLSTNGTFLNDAETPVGRGQAVAVTDGDRILLGAYELSVRIAAETAAAAIASPGDMAAAPGPGPGALPAPLAAAPEAEILQALAQGLGLPAQALAGAGGAAEAAERTAAALRIAVAGLRLLLATRAEVKRDFRIEQTMLRTAAPNNPVKFSATAEDALRALLAGPPEALAGIEEAVADLAAHEVATVEACRAAARAVLDRLSPAAIGAAAGPPRGAGVGALLRGAVPAAVPGAAGGGSAREQARLWDAYLALHERVALTFEDDFESAFGTAFARAYERAARDPARRRR